MTPDTPRDLWSLLEARAIAAGEAAAILTEDGQVICYAGLLERVGAAAGGLRAATAAAGRPRPRIGIALRNGSGLALTLLAAMLAGVAVPFNPALGPDDALAQLTRARIDVLVVARDTGDSALAAAAALLGVPVMSLPQDGAGAAVRPPRPRPDDVAVVLMTSGSTGGAKLVPLSHRNICVSAGDVARSMELGPGDRCLSMWEQHHVGGVVDLLLAPLASGGSVVMTPGFDARRFFGLVAATRPTWFQGVPATLAELVRQARRDGQSGPGSLRLIRSVAAALLPGQLAEIEAVFGVPVIQTFGMTEAGPLITSTALPPARRKPGSVGRSCGPELRIFGPDGGDAPSGVAGEVAIRGENVFAGYEDDPGANARTFRDGWFLTGDLGRIDDDGDLFLTGRLKQLINRGGEKFGPDEIEAALTEHPAIAEAAAFAVPHPTLGEDVAAAVVPEAGAVLSAADVRDWIAGRLAPFKVPGRVVFIEALPRTPVGKVDRPALATLAARATASPPPHRSDGADDLTAFVAAVWSVELEAPEVGPDDDFAALGGDSLSSLRVQLALQSAFGIEIPDADARRLATVRATAAYLARRGAKAPGADASHYLGAVAPGAFDAGADPAAEYTALGLCRTPSELRARFDTIAVRLAPAELSALLSAPPGAGRTSQGAGLRLRVMWWRARTRWSLARHPDAMAWTRRSLTSHLELYSAGGEARGGKTLIVGFAGNLMRLMLPAWTILPEIDHRKFDLMVVCDPERNHFSAGVPGLGGSIPELAASLTRHAEGYRRTLAFGTSAGGLAALAVAGCNGWDAVAVGADRLSSHPDIAAILRGNARNAGHLRLCYGAGRAQDAEAAAEVADLAGRAVLQPHRGVGQHNLLLHLKRRDRLRPAFDAWFAEPVRTDVPEMTRA